MDEFIMLLAGAFGAAWGLWVVFCIGMLVLWCILPIFIIMMNNKLKKINLNLCYIVEGKTLPTAKWNGFPEKKLEPLPDDDIIDLTDIVE